MTETPQHRYTAELAGEIEVAWQDRWEERGTFFAANPQGPLTDGEGEGPQGASPYFIMDMFPYPSGAGLHVGHPLGYIATDVVGRFRRMCGENVLHALGYDAFGLPAEQYAVQTGQHPRTTTEANIANMKRQLRRLGLGHDERRAVATTDVDFYRWTQWIFLTIYNAWYDTEAGKARRISELESELESGARTLDDGRDWAALSDAEKQDALDAYRLVYRSDSLVNWCPGLGTVLANEEVTAEGRSERGNFPVFRKNLRQWMMGLPGDATDYQLNNSYQLKSLSYSRNGQQWHVAIGDYDTKVTPSLPANLELTEGDQRIKLRMDSWTLQ